MGWNYKTLTITQLHKFLQLNTILNFFNFLIMGGNFKITKKLRDLYTKDERINARLLALYHLIENLDCTLQEKNQAFLFVLEIQSELKI